MPGKSESSRLIGRSIHAFRAHRQHATTTRGFEDARFRTRPAGHADANPTPLTDRRYRRPP